VDVVLHVAIYFTSLLHIEPRSHDETWFHVIIHKSPFLSSKSFIQVGGVSSTVYSTFVLWRLARFMMPFTRPPALSKLGMEGSENLRESSGKASVISLSSETTTGLSLSSVLVRLLESEKEDE